MSLYPPLLSYPGIAMNPRTAVQLLSTLVLLHCVVRTLHFTFILTLPIGYLANITSDSFAADPHAEVERLVERERKAILHCSNLIDQCQSDDGAVAQVASKNKSTAPFLCVPYFANHIALAWMIQHEQRRSA